MTVLIRFFGLVIGGFAFPESGRSGESDNAVIRISTLTFIEYITDAKCFLQCNRDNLL